MPPALENRPYIDGHLLWYYESFNTLSRFRGWSEGIPAPIGLSDIYTYLDEAGIFSPSERNDFMRAISDVDGAFVSHFANKRSAEIERMKKK